MFILLAKSGEKIVLTPVYVIHPWVCALALLKNVPPFFNSVRKRLCSIRSRQVFP
jgi:hypothetical protein